MADFFPQNLPQDVYDIYLAKALVTRFLFLVSLLKLRIIAVVDLYPDPPLSESLLAHTTLNLRQKFAPALFFHHVDIRKGGLPRSNQGGEVMVSHSECSSSLPPRACS